MSLDYYMHMYLSTMYLGDWYSSSLRRSGSDDAEAQLWKGERAEGTLQGIEHIHRFFTIQSTTKFSPFGLLVIS